MNKNADKDQFNIEWFMPGDLEFFWIRDLGGKSAEINKSWDNIWFRFGSVDKFDFLNRSKVESKKKRLDKNRPSAF